MHKSCRFSSSCPAIFDMRVAGLYMCHSASWVRRKIYGGLLIGISFGGKLMVEKRELDDFIEREKSAPRLRRKAVPRKINIDSKNLLP